MSKKRNFFKDVWTSIKDFEKYEHLAADTVLRAIKYLLILTFIFTVIVSLVYTYKFHTIVSQVKDYINENIEELSIKDGKLNVLSSEPITIEDEDSTIQMIIIDTSEDANEEEYLKKINLYKTGILFLSDKAVISSEYLAEEENISYSNIVDVNVDNKEELIGLLSGDEIKYVYTVFFITILIYLFIVYFISNIIDAIVLGALGYLFARVIRMRLRYRATFNIGIYSSTLPIILSLIYIIVNTLTDFEISYFQWMYTSISYVYVAVAILMIKTEVINQRIQVMELEQIQEELDKEEEQKRQEEEQNKEREKREREKEKQEKENNEKPKEKENKNEKTGAGEEPEGSNA